MFLKNYLIRKKIQKNKMQLLQFRIDETFRERNLLFPKWCLLEILLL